ncbi:metalloregulator ArsR/SmtB family transcription factor [Georgenia sp. TF02-10]|uniref:ArsR/SmtB family transcription factor n=1 Tax=Georgenia sp. TF02-10 TaxID=2917725 RepID=UPI001FA6BAD8|nr:metalloregulator ArsR/SmtB family transcription factor [Georgenia sp. TF02-10]UNX55001.1 metalloregulator ArsR/SmtB family transcription factor [Georgenia sp. TF02-10]
MAIPASAAPPVARAPTALAPAAALFHGLADPARLAILQHLSLGEHRVRDLTEHLGLAQSTVSAHLACLRRAGLVTSRPVGRASWFSLTSAPELLAVLAAAEDLLRVNGAAVALRPTCGVVAAADAPDPPQAPRAVP